MSVNKQKATLLSLPREHGFWIMLSAAVISSVGRSHWQALAIGVSLLAALVAIVVAALVHKAVRRSEWAQLIASSMLALLIVPAEVLSEVPNEQLLSNLLAWTGLFTGSSLTVRAAFARVRRKPGTWEAIASVLVPLLATVVLYLIGDETAMRVSLVGCLGMMGMAVWRPVPKQLKKTGLLLTLIVTVALVVELAV